MIKKQKQSVKNEQINNDKTIVLDYDQPLTKREDILNVYKKYLGTGCEIENYNGKTIYVYTGSEIKEYFLTSSITYLGNPHPLFKKRCQLKQWFKDFYNEYKNKPNTNIRLIGIYHYNDIILFAEFNTDDYLKNKCNSSAAHVYSNDIYQAVENGIFEKIDKNKNHITVVAAHNFKQYLTGQVKGNSLLEIFKNFNARFPFNKWITAQEAISEMKEAGWAKWKETEWAGWYLEFLFNKFLEQEKITEIVYTGNKNKSGRLDFDLRFDGGKFYGDLKSSDIIKKDAPGNDQKNVLEAISSNEKLWYIIYEHETIKDTSRNSEMAIMRMELTGEHYEIGGHISYKERMKHSVRFNKMAILELNKVNMNEVLSEFKQGHQPSGDARKPKFLIKKKDIDNYTILTYEADENL